MNKSKNYLQTRWDALYAYRFYLLLIAIALFILLPAFFPERNEGIVWTVSRTLILLACINILRCLDTRILISIVVLALVVAGTDWFTVSNKQDDFTSLANLVLFGIFVALISYVVFDQVLKSRDVDFHIIVGAFCGFLLIGLITMICCTYFHLKDPESFSNVEAGITGVDDILYFSYITILTIGYGDISPLTEETRRISLFFGLIGQFYLAVIMAVLVGKFIGEPGSTHESTSKP